MKIFCLGLIIFSVVVIVVGIIKVHELPGEIAKSRGHPQAEAIRICSLLGLIVFPFWMIALLWAYIRPVMTPISNTADLPEGAQVAPVQAQGEQL